MKRNYLFKSYFQKIYTDIYSEELEELIKEYFNLFVKHDKISSILTCYPSYKTIEKYLYYFKVGEETNKNLH